MTIKEVNMICDENFNTFCDFLCDYIEDDVSDAIDSNIFADYYDFFNPLVEMLDGTNYDGIAFATKEFILERFTDDN